MATLLKLILLALFGTCYIGCAPSGGGSSSAQATPAPSIVSQDPTSPDFVMPPAGTQMTYYKVTTTTAPVNGWITKKITMSGSCMVYQSKTYCWDDGVKTIPSWVVNNYTYGPFSYTFFSMGSTPTPLAHCSGGCVTDAMSSPTVLSQNLASNIAANVSPTYIQNVFQTGTPISVTCTEANGILNCVDFQINLNQVQL